MTKNTVEETVAKCYSTWDKTYYDEYYGNKAAYPPINRDIVKKLLKDSGVKNVLDAGCGPASMLRDLADLGIDLYGFDLTPEMISEAQRIFRELGLNNSKLWEGSVTDSESFHMPYVRRFPFDSAICIGVLPHIPAEHDITVIKNLHDAVKQGGLVILEARNQFFSLFTLNRYSWEFFMGDLIRIDELKKNVDKSTAKKIWNIILQIQNQFRVDLPPIRKGKEDEPGYDEVLSRTHNPLILKEQFEKAGFKNVQLLFYHYHCLPPMVASDLPEFFLKESIAMEDPYDWRGMFMASAFLLVGVKE